CGLRYDEARDAARCVEVLLRDLRGLDLHPERRFDPVHELHDAERRDDAISQERVIVAQLLVAAHVQKVLDHEAPDPVEDLGVVHLHSIGAGTLSSMRTSARARESIELSGAASTNRSYQICAESTATNAWFSKKPVARPD